MAINYRHQGLRITKLSIFFGKHFAILGSGNHKYGFVHLLSESVYVSFKCIYVLFKCIYVLFKCIYVLFKCIYVSSECIYVLSECIYVSSECIYVSSECIYVLCKRIYVSIKVVQVRTKLVQIRFFFPRKVSQQEFFGKSYPLSIHIESLKSIILSPAFYQISKH